MSAAVDNGLRQSGSKRSRSGARAEPRLPFYGCRHVPMCDMQDTADSFRVWFGEPDGRSRGFGPDIRVGIVTDKRQDDIADIEATQAALKESIQATKDLADKAEHLLQRHKRNLERDAASAELQAVPASPVGTRS